MYSRQRPATRSHQHHVAISSLKKRQRQEPKMMSPFRGTTTHRHIRPAQEATLAEKQRSVNRRFLQTPNKLCLSLSDTHTQREDAVGNQTIKHQFLNKQPVKLQRSSGGAGTICQVGPIQMCLGSRASTRAGTPSCTLRSPRS